MWEIGDDATIKAHDVFLVQSSVKLRNVLINHGPCSEVNPLIDLVDNQGNWNWNIINDDIPGGCVEQIRAVTHPQTNRWNQYNCI